jgi:hypothetical protein
VRADPAGDLVTRDGNGARERQRRVERPDDAVLEDHDGTLTLLYRRALWRPIS